MKSSFLMQLVVYAGFVALASSPLEADPATVTSFSWTVSGQTAASASATCPTKGCDPTGGCSSSPGPNFSISGTTMEEFFTSNPSAQHGCTAGCTCCMGGAGGGADAAASITILAESSPDSTLWNFGAFMITSAGAGVSPECGISASGDGDAQQSWQLTFEATEPVRLIFSRILSLAVINEGNTSTSTISLFDGAGTLFSQTISRSESGGTIEDGTVILFLEPGEYMLSMNSELISTEMNAGGGSAESWLYSTLQSTPFVCPSVTTPPKAATLCSGATATFSIDAEGTSVNYRWRRDGIELLDGPTGTGSTIAGVIGTMLTIYGVTPEDNGLYDCVASNECDVALSGGATLTVLDGGSGDGNADSLVDGADIQGMIAAQLSGGPPSAPYCAYDINANGTVECFDLPLFVDLLLAD